MVTPATTRPAGSRRTAPTTTHTTPWRVRSTTVCPVSRRLLCSALDPGLRRELRLRFDGQDGHPGAVADRSGHRAWTGVHGVGTRPARSLGTPSASRSGARARRLSDRLIDCRRCRDWCLGGSRCRASAVDFATEGIGAARFPASVTEAASSSSVGSCCPWGERTGGSSPGTDLGTSSLARFTVPVWPTNRPPARGDGLRLKACTSRRWCAAPPGNPRRVGASGCRPWLLAEWRLLPE